MYTSFLATPQHDPSTKQAMEIIEIIPYFCCPVYLGGSRRMNQLTTDKDALLVGAKVADFIPIGELTDYDYYMTHTPLVEEYLLSKGFINTAGYKKAGAVQTEAYPLDTECVSILSLGQVQICLRKDAEFYRAVFDNIDPVIYRQYLWKSSPNHVNRTFITPFFNMMFAIKHASLTETVK